MSDPSCPCDVAAHPRIIVNPPGRDVIDYRVGDYTTFRHALLRPLADETALAGWHPDPGGDLALQLLEWWAYLADVLAFYNERALHEVLLRTAVVPEDVRRIVRLLGYRPRPGVGATGVVAALPDATQPFVLPRGFAIAGASPPGQPAQIFELDRDVTVGVLGQPLPWSARFPEVPGGAGKPTWRGLAPRDGKGRLLPGIPAKAPTDDKLPIEAGKSFQVGLDGVVASLKPGDVILVLRRDWDGVPDVLPGPKGFALATVQQIEPAWNEAGHAITGLTARSAHDLPGDAERAHYRILRATKLAHLWLYHARYPGSSDPSNLAASAAAQFGEMLLGGIVGGLLTGSIPTQPPRDPRVLFGGDRPIEMPVAGTAHLEAITRGISAGDPVLFERRLPGGIGGAVIGGISEIFDRIVGGIDPAALASLRQQLSQLVRVNGYTEEIWYANPPEPDRYGQGPPVGPPRSGIVTDIVGAGAGPIPIPHSKITFDLNPFLDAMGLALETIVVHYAWQEVGTLVAPPPTAKPTSSADVPKPDDVPPGVQLPVVIRDATGRGTPGWLGRNEVTDGKELVPPLDALIHLLPVSRGQSVGPEILGSGDPAAAGQEFVLAHAPLTYLADPGPHAQNGYGSTLRVRVGAIEWREVASFYEQPAHARVFVTREDDAQQTLVRFGDGVNGARLPAGVGNVIATYRWGSGAAVPPVGTLTSILEPRPGLQAIADPVGVAGGADPDPPDEIRRYAPRSVLTFDRAISGDDYEAIAAQTPGVRRARVSWSWDAGSQRTRVKVYVGDDAAAVAAVKAALLACSDPNRPVLVALAAPLDPDVELTLEVDPAYDPAVVEAAVVAALLDPRAQPFGSEVVRIGQVVYDSEIYDACLRVPGVVAVHGLRFGLWGPPLTLAPLSFDPAGLVGDLFLGGLVGGAGAGAASIFDPAGILAGGSVGGASLVESIFGPIGALTAALTADVLHVESDPRHSPPEGRFYLLRDDRLHVHSELALHGL
jgi:hypothetical protein